MVCANWRRFHTCLICFLSFYCYSQYLLLLLSVCEQNIINDDLKKWAFWIILAKNHAKKTHLSGFLLFLLLLGVRPCTPRPSVHEMSKINLPWRNTQNAQKKSSVCSFIALGQWYTCIMWRLFTKSAGTEGLPFVQLSTYPSIFRHLCTLTSEQSRKKNNHQRIIQINWMCLSNDRRSQSPSKFQK